MLTVIEKQQLKNTVQRVLHVPGNYGGGILEMAFVLDHALEGDYIRALSADIAMTLKQSDEVFANVRLNIVDWFADDSISSNTGALAGVCMGRPFLQWEQSQQPKRLECLCEYLKKFQARSKLIIVMNKVYEIEDRARLEEALKPFLVRKLIILQEPQILYRNF